MWKSEQQFYWNHVKSLVNDNCGVTNQLLKKLWLGKTKDLHSLLQNIDIKWPTDYSVGL